MRCSAALLLTILSAAPMLSADAAAPQPLIAANVLDHLNKTISWYRHIVAVDQMQTASENLLFQDNVRETSKRAVELAFAFARAEAAVLQASGQDTAGSAAAAPIENRTLQQAALTANQRVSSLESQIASLSQQIGKQTGRKRVTLTSQRDTFAAYLDLAKESQQAIRNIMSFANAPGTSSPQSGLLDQIDELANSDSVPSALNRDQKSSSSMRIPEPFHPESAGIAALLARSMTLRRSQRQVDSLIAESTALLSGVDVLKAPLRADLRSAINDGNVIASAADTQDDPAKLAAARKQINDLALRFKNSSNVMIPLGEQGIVLEDARGRLQDWRNALSQQDKSILRYLAVRLAILLLAITVIFILSALWRKGIFKYVREARRRRQLLLVRRFVIGFGIALAAALGFFTSFGSVATIIGFLTAGLALALQNVILSMVAYFFLIGRYGLKVGDRVTVSGVTGQVIEIGLVRFFMMELAGTGADVHPTGRVAAWANSMIFQPYSWLKQAPGTEYAWHLVTVTVAPEVDSDLARTRVTNVVNSVFEEYRENIEQQHAAFEQSTNLQMTAPKPVTRTRFTEDGCDIFIRYPVEFERAGEIDAQVLERLASEIDKNPVLKLAPGGAPKLHIIAA